MTNSRRSLTLLSVALMLLAAGSSAWARGPGRPDRDCAIRRAEATICPSFRVFEEGVIIRALSGDGATAVGSVVTDSASRPVRWVNGRRRELPGLPPGLLFGAATAVSRDGSVIAGFATFGPAPGFLTETFRWRRGRYESISDDIGFGWTPAAMSGDGRVIVDDGGAFGGRWREEVDAFEFWRSSRGIPISPTGITDTGDVIVGIHDSVPLVPFQWVDDVTTEFPAPPSPLGFFVAGVSPDGSVAVGGDLGSDFGPPVGGAVWRDGVFGPLEFAAARASWDGVFMAGGNSGGPAYYWDATGTVRELSALLADLGVAVAVSPRETRAMSYDGHVVIGAFRGEDGFSRYFQAVVAPKLGIDVQPHRRWNRIDLARRRPIRVRVYGSDQAGASDIDPEDLRFGPDRAAPGSSRRARDYNRDGHLDRDFLFDPAEAGIALGDREACLSGVAADLPFRLCSRVRVTVEGCGRGGELALIAPVAFLLRNRTRRRLR